ncbi:uncharacterized protein LOC135477612 isoform X2 [Liolophura sinensis]|uniref:uncharacterized protein LOC135477612 isoform X2 n=1 Tax=Liolophura sinensis TaxID=3198878 RepID=UPI0031595C47
MAIPSYHLLTFVLLITTMVSQRKVLADDCTKISACSCKNSQGTIDLSPLDSGGGDPKFKDIQSSDAGGNSFSWNPCTPFSEGDGTCTNVASCQVQPGNPPAYFNIGKQETATFQTDGSGKITLHYVDNTSDGRKTVINLNCDNTQDPGTVTAQGETVTKQYTLTYTGKYACPKAAPPSTTPKPGPEPGPGGLSVGSILCIVVFTTLIVYIVAGILIQKFVRKAAGKEMIPQYSFWSATPGLIKDGVLFTVRRGRVGKSYDNI